MELYIIIGLAIGLAIGLLIGNFFMKNQFTAISENVLENRTAALATQNKEQLSKIIEPLENSLKDMKDAVRTAEDNQKMLKEQTDKLETSTVNLVNALNYDKQYQGKFGEMQLFKLLEDFGFQEGPHFKKQFTIVDNEGNAVMSEKGQKLRPDAIIHFPGGRDIIIDVKTSTNALVKYTNASTDDERKTALNEHIQAVKNQVNDLAAKEYWRYYNENTPDRNALEFVIMFIPFESAMQLAISHDSMDLWKEAYEKKVIITGPNNLYSLMHLLYLAWQQQTQIENQKNIINCATDIISRVRSFRDRYIGVRNNLRDVILKEFTDLDRILADDGTSIITPAKKLLEYGAKEEKRKKDIENQKKNKYQSLKNFKVTPLNEEINAEPFLMEGGDEETSSMEEEDENPSSVEEVDEPRAD